MSGHTQTIRNGESIRLNILSGESVAVKAVSGTYDASLVQGAGLGAIATAATGATYGPYASGIVILLTASATSEIAFVVGVSATISSYTQTYATASKTHAAITATAIAAAAAAAAPAGGTGAAAGAWDTAANRDAAIATINGLRTEMAEVRLDYTALLADMTNLKQVVNSIIDDLQLKAPVL